MSLENPDQQQNDPDPAQFDFELSCAISRELTVTAFWREKVSAGPCGLSDQTSPL